MTIKIICPVCTSRVVVKSTRGRKDIVCPYCLTKMVLDHREDGVLFIVKYQREQWHGPDEDAPLDEERGDIGPAGPSLKEDMNG